jgi:hypothetical protein
MRSWIRPFDLSLVKFVIVALLFARTPSPIHGYEARTAPGRRWWSEADCSTRTSWNVQQRHSPLVLSQTKRPVKEAHAIVSIVHFCKASSTRLAAAGTGKGYYGSGSRAGATASSAAAMYGPAVENLNRRKIRAQETEDASSKFEGPASCRATVEAFFSLLLSPKENNNDESWTNDAGPLWGAFDGAYESESDFNRAVFRAMAGCVGALTRNEKSAFLPARIRAEKAIVLEPKRRASSWEDGQAMEYATGLVRGSRCPWIGAASSNRRRFRTTRGSSFGDPLGEKSGIGGFGSHWRS